MERESFEDAGRRRVHERALRLHQGRPRGAARRRRDLHGGVPGDDRPGRLAAERLPHAGPGAVLRRHLLPARAAPGHAELARSCSRRSSRRGPSAARRSASGAPRIVERLQGAALAGAVDARSWTPRLLDRRRPRTCAQPFDPRSGAASAARRSSRRPRRSSSCCAAASREMTPQDAARRWPRGGMYDQIGGGFARYSVDAHWLVPHFEKMLYDNALLARAYLHAWQVTGRRPLRARLRPRRSTGRCARCAAPRAASTRRSTPTPRARRASSTSGRAPSCARADRRRRRATGSAPPAAATSRARTSSRAAQDEPEQARRVARRRSTSVRAKRVWPGLDDKRLASWNALMISALADAGAVLERDDYLDAAREVRRLRADARCATTSGRLLRTWKDGRGQPERLPGGPRLPGRGAADAVRGDLRAALVQRGARARRHDDRALRRRRARRLLRHRLRPRAADRRGARTSRTTRSRPATRAPRTGCCAWPR